MNSYVRRFIGEDAAIQQLVSFKRPKDRRLVIGSCIMAASIYIAVYLSEERQRERRHASIGKDIERERWRAKELGLMEPVDDGFAENYIASKGALKAGRGT